MRHASAPLLAAALLAAATLAACGQPFLSARVEVPEIRIVQAPQDFPAMSFDPAFACSILTPQNPQACSGQSLEPFDVGDGLDEKGVKAELRLTAVVLHLNGADSRGIRRFELDLVTPATGHVTTIARYTAPTGGAVVRDLVAQTPDLDLVSFLKSGKLEPRVEVEMDPAYLQTGFSAAFEAAFSVKVTLDYKPYL